MPQFKSTIIKIDFSDHFPIVNTLETNETSQKPVAQSTYKRSYCEKTIGKFTNTLQNRNWDDIKKIEDPNKAYKYFLDIVINICDKSFPKTKVKVKFKSDQNPCITRGVEKSSKKKQRIYVKFSKNKPSKMKRHIKLIKPIWNH